MGKIALLSNRIVNFFVRNETWIFAALVLLNTIPLLTSRYFVTVDGPAHLYNASIINNLLFGSDSSIHDLYSFNTEPVPNWTAHLLLAFFKLIGPSWFAEKAFLMLYVIGLPYSFRFMLRSAGIKTPYVALLVVPFTYTFLLLMGFFNFSIAFISLFIFLGIYFKTKPEALLKKAFQLIIWSLILYFSHIYVFATGISIIALHSVMTIFNNKENRLRFALKYCGILCFIMLPVIILFFSFILKHSSSNFPGEMNMHERLSMMWKMQFIALYSIEGCMPFTTLIGCGLLLLFSAGLIKRCITAFQGKKNLFRIGDSFLTGSIILFILFLKLPDGIGGGMNCIRVFHLFTICLAAWIAFNLPPLIVTVPVIILILSMQVCLLNYYISSNQPFSAEAEEWADAGAIPEKNSTTIPIFFDKNWLNHNNTAYYGTVNSRAITYNYEVVLNWFPISRHKPIMVRLAGQTNYNPWGDCRISELDTPLIKIADYVAVWRAPVTQVDSILFRPVDSLLKLNYTINFRSKNMRLFKRKN